MFWLKRGLGSRAPRPHSTFQSQPTAQLYPTPHPSSTPPPLPLHQNFLGILGLHGTVQKPLIALKAFIWGNWGTGRACPGSHSWSSMEHGMLGKEPSVAGCLSFSQLMVLTLVSTASCLWFYQSPFSVSPFSVYSAISWISTAIASHWDGCHCLPSGPRPLSPLSDPVPYRPHPWR